MITNISLFCYIYMVVLGVLVSGFILTNALPNHPVFPSKRGEGILGILDDMPVHGQRHSSLIV